MGDTHAGRPAAPDDRRGPSRHALDADPRVTGVLDVLAGQAPADVARRLAVDETQVGQWVRAFVDAGAARIGDRPEAGLARRHDRFLSTFTHALRAQLAVTQMWAGLLRDPGTSPDDAAARLQEALDRLDATAHDVELITAAMLGRLRPDARSVGLAELVAGLTPPPALDPGAARLRLTVDPALFARVLHDLWHAALTVRPVPQRVDLETAVGAGWVEIRVVRLGAPVDPAVLAAMFEPFDRDSDDARVTVGLFLAQALAAVHDATVVVQQERSRTVLAVRLPTGRAPAG